MNTNLPPHVRLFDALERAWDSPTTRRAIGALLVGSFVAVLVVIEFQRLGLLPKSLHRIPVRHFYAVDVAFTLLLLLEVVAPPPFNAAVGVGSALFALALTLAYNRFLPVSASASGVASTG